MGDYKIIALAYNKWSEGRWEASIEKLIDAENGFLQADDRFIWSRKSKLLEDLKGYTKSNPETDNCVFVTRLKYSIDRPAEYDQLIGRVHNTVKNMDIAVVFLLECEKNKESFILQDFQCKYGIDADWKCFLIWLLWKKKTKEKSKPAFWKTNAVSHAHYKNEIFIWFLIWCGYNKNQGVVCCVLFKKYGFKIRNYCWRL